MNSKTSTKIKTREVANDVFYTPIGAVNSHIRLIDSKPDDKWFEPFYGGGAYFNAFPTDNKDWTEIAMGKDFFDYDKPCDIICSNPPYSILNKVLQKSVDLKPRVISYLIGQHNLTTKRIEFMNSCGYYLKKLHLLKIYDWYGLSMIVVFERDCSNCISFERTPYYTSKSV